MSVLSALLASWQPIERRLAGCGEWSALGLDPRLGEATHLLRADLDAVAEPSAVGEADLGRTGEVISAGWSGTAGGAGRQASDVPRFDTAAEAVGGRYVLLGSALGGRIIAPVVARRLDLPERSGTRFFRRDGMEPGRDWRTFRMAVAARDWSPEELEQAAAAARETFAFVGRAAAAFLPLRLPAARRVA